MQTLHLSRIMSFLDLPTLCRRCNANRIEIYVDSIRLILWWDIS